MTRKEAERQTRQADTLRELGFTREEAEALRRISLTLHRWAEHECNGTIERDEARGNRPFWSNPDSGRHYVAPVTDREAGALKRLKAIVEARNVRKRGTALHSSENLAFYVQGDPRGAMLYILRPGDVPDGKDVASYYSRGIVVY